MTEQPINPYAPPPFVEEELVPAQHIGPLQPTEYADIQPVPEQDRGQTYNLTHLIMMNVVGGFPLLLWAGSAILLWRAYAIKDTGPLSYSITFIALGTIGIITGVVIGTWYVYLLEAIYSRWRFRAAVRNRPSSMVNPDEQDVAFIGISLREHWKQIKLDTCHDIGLLQLNQSKSLVLIESDKERFQIPKGSLFLCEPEVFTHPIDPSTEFWLIRLVVQLPDEPREILIGLSHTDFMPRSNAIRKAKSIVSTDYEHEVVATSNHDPII
ncbi:MAG: hypothetical protein COA78_37985 [Blastopirellula sp.]|nr:MAG: hypothetical protein COA78_37985 [Blastopirellula sp.]